MSTSFSFAGKYPSRKCAPHLQKCGARLLIGLSINETADCLRLNQIHFAVHYRPQGKFTGSCHPSAQAKNGSHNSSKDQRISVCADFKDVFAGVCIGEL